MNFPFSVAAAAGLKKMAKDTCAILSSLLQSKCLRYWPELTKTTAYRLMNVTHESEEQLSDHILRVFKVENTKTQRVRHIYHYYFMSWPDHGVPAQPGPVLAYMEDINKQQLLLASHDDVGPMIVHCRFVSESFFYLLFSFSSVPVWS